jgi:hypothetical protein
MRRGWTEWPDGFALDADLRNYARDRGFIDREIEAMFQHFGDHAAMHGRLCRDWRAAWRTWVRNEIELMRKYRVRPVRSLDEHIAEVTRRIPRQGRLF